MDQPSHKINSRTQALIFDLDGTVLDNEDVWGQAFRKVLESLGAEVDLERPHVPGIGVKENWPRLLEKYNVKTNKTAEELDSLTRKNYSEYSDQVALHEGFENFIDSARKMGYLTALATSNIWMNVEDVFDWFDIQGYFDVITTGEEAIEKKPNPSLFLITSQKLGVAPGECVVFEDSPSGISAAKSAGMFCVAITIDVNNDDISDADIIVEDFSDIKLEEIEESGS